MKFPPRDQALAFRQELEATFRDVLRRTPTSSFVDVEGDIVWTTEYLRYRVNNCSHAEATQSVLDQVRGGAAAQTACGTAPAPSGGVSDFVTSVSSDDSALPRSSAAAGPTRVPVRS